MYDGVFQIHLREHFGHRSEDFSKDLLKLLRALWQDGVDTGANRMCLCCGAREEVKLEDPRTRYTPTSEDPDPNAAIPLCLPCAAEHHARWDDQWDEYHAGCR